MFTKMGGGWVLRRVQHSTICIETAMSDLVVVVDMDTHHDTHAP
jgi:hypothetical protein